MKGWMQFMRQSTATEVRNMRKKVVTANRSQKLVKSLTDLQNLKEVKSKT
jgi:hypothetical protein